MDDKAFIDAILAAPDDDAPRLVYADWLTERGDPRGELIVVGCTEARLEREGRTSSREYQLASRRAAELFNKHHESWLGPLGLEGVPNWGRFRRGFLTELAITVAELRRRWSVFERLPLERITLAMDKLATTIGDVAWVVAAAVRVRRVVIKTSVGELECDRAVIEAEPRYGSEHTLPWAAGAVHPKLQSAVRGIFLSYPSPEYVAELAPLGGVERIHFADARLLTPDDMTALMAAPLTRKVTELSIFSPEDASAGALFRAKSLPALRDLLVRRNWKRTFTPDVNEAFATSELLPSLEALGTDLTLDAAVVDALEARATSLTRLALEHAPAPGALEAFLATSCARRLQRLAVVVSEPGAVHALANAKLDQLRSLSLLDVTLDDEGARALVEAPGLASVETLSGVGNCGFSTKAILRTRWPEAWITG